MHHLGLAGSVRAGGPRVTRSTTGMRAVLPLFCTRLLTHLSFLFLQACSAVTGPSTVVHSTAEELSTRFTTGDIDNMTGNEAVKLLKK